MEVYQGFTEMLIHFCLATWCHIMEDGSLHRHHHEQLKSHKFIISTVMTYF